MLWNVYTVITLFLLKTAKSNRYHHHGALGHETSVYKGIQYWYNYGRLMTFSEAYKECVYAPFFGKLAIIRTEDVQKHIEENLPRFTCLHGPKVYFFIGLNDVRHEGVWQWPDNTYLKPNDYTNWRNVTEYDDDCSNEPNGGKLCSNGLTRKNQDRVVVSACEADFGKWYDDPLIKPRFFICQRKERVARTTTTQTATVEPTTTATTHDLTTGTSVLPDTEIQTDSAMTTKTVNIDTTESNVIEKPTSSAKDKAVSTIKQLTTQDTLQQKDFTTLQPTLIADSFKIETATKSNTLINDLELTTLGYTTATGATNLVLNGMESSVTHTSTDYFVTDKRTQPKVSLKNKVFTKSKPVPTPFPKLNDELESTNTVTETTGFGNISMADVFPIISQQEKRKFEDIKHSEGANFTTSDNMIQTTTALDKNDPKLGKTETTNGNRALLFTSAFPATFKTTKPHVATSTTKSPGEIPNSDLIQTSTELYTGDSVLNKIEIETLSGTLPFTSVIPTTTADKILTTSIYSDNPNSIDIPNKIGSLPFTNGILTVFENTKPSVVITETKSVTVIPTTDGNTIQGTTRINSNNSILHETEVVNENGLLPVTSSMPTTLTNVKPSAATSEATESINSGSLSTKVVKLTTNVKNKISYTTLETRFKALQTLKPTIKMAEQTIVESNQISTVTQGKTKTSTVVTNRYFSPPKPKETTTYLGEETIIPTLATDGMILGTDENNKVPHLQTMTTKPVIEESSPSFDSAIKTADKISDSKTSTIKPTTNESHFTVTNDAISFSASSHEEISKSNITEGTNPSFEEGVTKSLAITDAMQSSTSKSTVITTEAVRPIIENNKPTYASKLFKPNVVESTKPNLNKVVSISNKVENTTPSSGKTKVTESNNFKMSTLSDTLKPETTSQNDNIMQTTITSPVSKFYNKWTTTTTNPGTYTKLTPFSPSEAKRITEGYKFTTTSSLSSDSEENNAVEHTTRQIEISQNTNAFASTTNSNTIVSDSNVPYTMIGTIKPSMSNLDEDVTTISVTDRQQSTLKSVNKSKDSHKTITDYLFKARSMNTNATTIQDKDSSSPNESKATTKVTKTLIENVLQECFGNSLSGEGKVSCPVHSSTYSMNSEEVDKNPINIWEDTMSHFAAGVMLENKIKQTLTIDDVEGIFVKLYPLNLKKRFSDDFDFKIANEEEDSKNLVKIRRDSVTKMDNSLALVTAVLGKDAIDQANLQNAYPAKGLEINAENAKNKIDHTAFALSENTSVISVSLFEHDTTVDTRVKKHSIPAKITFDISNDLTVINYYEKTERKIVSGGIERKCVFYDQENKTWSTYGCITTLEDQSTVSCKSNHTTAFAVMVSMRTIEIPPKLNLTIYIMEIITTVFLILTLMMLLFVRKKLRKDRTFTQINLTVSLVSLHMFFILGNIAEKTTSSSFCAATAVFSHFFLISSAMWMLNEGVVLYQKTCGNALNFDIRNVYIRLLVFGWIVPAVYISLCAGIGFSMGAYMDMSEIYVDILHKFGSSSDKLSNYNKYDSCWLSTKSYMTLSAAIPVLIVLFINTILLVRISMVVWTMSKRSDKLKKLGSNDKKQSHISNHTKSTVKASLLLMPILGIPWILAFFVNIPNAEIIFVGLHGILSGLHGEFLFFIYCCYNHEMRGVLRRKLQSSTIVSSWLSGSRSPKPNSRSGSKMRTSTISNKYSFEGEHSSRL